MDQKGELLSALAVGGKQDAKWARRNFLVGQTFVWVAILASFASAIASATGKVPPILIAICAAIPGTIILIDRSFSFASRAHWHYLRGVRQRKIANALAYEGMAVADASKQWSDLLVEMEERYPRTVSDGLTSPNAGDHHAPGGAQNADHLE